MATRRVILVVDDDPSLREVFREAFTTELPDAAYEVREAVDGPSAVEAMRDPAIGVVLLDKNMPGMSGLEALSRARAQGCNAEVIVVTGYGTLESSITSMSLRTFAYVVKPFDLIEIRSLVARAFERRELELALAERTRALEQSNLSLAQAARALAEQQQKLVQAEKLAALGQVAAGVAHEINNPATYVLANIERLSRVAEQLNLAAAANPPRTDPADPSAPPAEAELAEIVVALRDGMCRIRDLASDLRTFSRMDRGPLEPVAIGAPIAAAVRILGAEARMKARVEVDIEPGLPTLRAYSGRLFQVVMNLLSNALQAVPPEHVSQNVVRVLARRTRGGLRVTVADNGPGVPPELAARIFEPFFTTKRAGEGTGLGLSICREIVEAHGGTLTLERPPGGGAAFHVDLPVAEATVTYGAIAPVTATFRVPNVPGGPRERARVLVVDDEPFILDACQRFLRRRHDVAVADSAEHALPLIDRADAFDAIVCDVSMDGMSGLAFLDLLRERWPRLADRTVFMTGHAPSGSAGDSVGGLLRGRPVLYKPVDMGELERTVMLISHPGDFDRAA